MAVASASNSGEGSTGLPVGLCPCPESVDEVVLLLGNVVYHVPAAVCLYPGKGAEGAVVSLPDETSLRDFAERYR
jgi:hypothetical protein